MSKHDYAFYVARKKAAKCQCGEYKAKGSMLCPACLDRLPAGDKTRLRKPNKDGFKDVPRAYDRALKDLSQA
jgi:hypothetical protein